GPAPDVRGHRRPAAGAGGPGAAARRDDQTRSTGTRATPGRGACRPARAWRDPAVPHAHVARAQPAQVERGRHAVPQRPGRVLRRLGLQMAAPPMTDSTASMQIHDELGERRHAAGRSIAPVGEPATLTGLQLQDRATIYRTDRMRPEVDAFRELRTQLLAVAD